MNELWGVIWFMVNDAGNEKSPSNSQSKCTQVKESHLYSALCFVLVYRDEHRTFNSDITSKYCKA